MARFLLTTAWLFSMAVVAFAQTKHGIRDHGAIIRSDTTQKTLTLIFSGHEFADGYTTIDSVLNQQGIKAAFFFTGDFYRNPAFQEMIRHLRSEGHYLGGHSDKHLLYCSWENRDSLLVSKDSFLLDLTNNYREMLRFGIRKADAPYLMPPYEWYNDSISAWASASGLTLINFTPGTYANADWTYPELGRQYLDSRTIFHRILTYEKEHSLNGFLLLLHIGTDPRRTDKFYALLDDLIRELKQRGYQFTSLKESMAE